MSVTYRDEAIYTLMRCRGGCQASEIFELQSLSGAFERSVPSAQGMVLEDVADKPRV